MENDVNLLIFSILKIKKIRQKSHTITYHIIFAPNIQQIHIDFVINVMQQNTVTINDIPYDLEGLEQLAWKLLVNGAVKSKDGFHTMCVGSVNANGEATQRIVVLRKTDEIAKKIYFHTDNRSRKIEDIERNSHLSILFYDAHRRIQMTLKTTVTLHKSDNLADERWTNTNPQSRRAYMTIDAPNTYAALPTSGYEERFGHSEPTAAESDVFRQNFVVVECQATALELLYLHYEGNRKAIFNYQNGIFENSHWAVP